MITHKSSSGHRGQPGEGELPSFKNEGVAAPIKQNAANLTEGRPFALGFGFGPAVRILNIDSSTQIGQRFVSGQWPEDRHSGKPGRTEKLVV